MSSHLRAISPSRLVVVSSILCGCWLAMPGFAADNPSPPLEVVATLKGHTDAVYTVAFSPDSKTVLTGGFDNAVKLWDAASGKEMKTFGGHQKQVLSVAYSPDGRLLASGSSDTTAKIWDFPSDKPLREFAHTDEVHAVAVSPDGGKLAGVGKDGTIKVWNAAEGKHLYDLGGQDSPATRAAFSPKGDLIAAFGPDRRLHVWGASDGKPLETLYPTHANGHKITAFAFHISNPQFFTGSADGTVKIWQIVARPKTLPAQSENIAGLVGSADGKAIVLAVDKTARIINPPDGAEVRKLEGPAAPLTSIAISPNGANVAGGTEDKQLFLWNAADGKVLGQLEAHDGAVTAVAFHPQNTQLLTAGSDGKVKLWPVPVKADTKPTKTWDAHAGGVTAVAFASNTQAMTAGKDKTIKFWDLNADKPARTIGPLNDPITTAVFSRDGTQLAAACGKTVKIFNVADGKELLTLDPPADVSSIAFNADKTRLAVGCADQFARVWDLTTGKELQGFRQTGAVRGVLFSADNKAIVCAADKNLSLCPISAQRIIQAGGAAVRGLMAMPNGNQLLTATEDSKIKLWNIGTGAMEKELAGVQTPVQAVAVAKNGALLAVAGADNAIRLIQLADGKVLAPIAVPAAVHALSFSPNNQALVAACEDKSLRSWNVAFTPGQPPPDTFGKPLRTFPHGGFVADAVCVEDGVNIYTACQDKLLRAWKLDVGGPFRSFAHPNLVDAVAFNPAGTQLATGCHDGVLRIWNVADGKPVQQIQAHTKPAVAAIYTVAWSPDGKQVASGGFDNTIRLWDASTGASVREFKAFKEKEFERGHAEAVACIAFSPDGQTLASGGNDRAIKIWNVADGAMLRDCVNSTLKPPPNTIAPPPHAHPGYVYSLRFTPDGKLASGGNAPGSQGYLAIWDPAAGKLLYGSEFPEGPIYSLSLSPDGKLIALACGPRARQTREGNGYVVKMPGGK